MFKNSKHIILILAIILAIFPSYAQGKMAFLKDQKKQKLSFEFINNVIIIPVTLNGKKLSFILDTGARSTILFGDAISDSLQLNNQVMTKIRGLGAGNSVDAIVSKNNRIKIKDIYGYNLITRKEFQITADSAHQTNPAISGTLAVWEDSRVTPANIYHTWLEDDVAADCPNRLAGDVDGDCRINLVDFVRMAEEWLTCALNPISACVN